MEKKQPGNSLSVWCLEDPLNPVKVGITSFALGGRGLNFTYDESWIDNGYILSGDIPLQSGEAIQKIRDFLPGAMDDAMPDRWGERAIRFLEKPKRAAHLDFLYYAGDRRFGMLGFSMDPNKYTPHDNGPLPEIDSINDLMDLIHRIEMNEPLNEREKLIVSTTKTMGGAHPKALLNINGDEWIVKFPRGTNTDIALIEHASMQLSKLAGITSAETMPIRSLFGHVVAIKRFDRNGIVRHHVASAKTALTHGLGAQSTTPELRDPEFSYGAMADILRQKASPETQSSQRKELFRRMIFNIMIDNTDDHEKNHAFIMDGKYWKLAPAYDVLPLMSNAGAQQMIIGDFGAEGTFDNALSQCKRFDLSRSEAINEWRSVSSVVSRWESEFTKHGVSKQDISYLMDFIDSEDKLNMRSISTDPLMSAPSSNKVNNFIHTGKNNSNI